MTVRNTLTQRQVDVGIIQRIGEMAAVAMQNLGKKDCGERKIKDRREGGKDEDVPAHPCGVAVRWKT